MRRGGRDATCSAHAAHISVKSKVERRAHHEHISNIERSPSHQAAAATARPQAWSCSRVARLSPSSRHTGHARKVGREQNEASTFRVSRARDTKRKSAQTLQDVRQRKDFLFFITCCVIHESDEAGATRTRSWARWLKVNRRSIRRSVPHQAFRSISSPLRPASSTVDGYRAFYCVFANRFATTRLATTPNAPSASSSHFPISSNE